MAIHFWAKKNKLTNSNLLFDSHEVWNHSFILFKCPNSEIFSLLCMKNFTKLCTHGTDILAGISKISFTASYRLVCWIRSRGWRSGFRCTLVQLCQIQMMKYYILCHLVPNVNSEPVLKPNVTLAPALAQISSHNHCPKQLDPKRRGDPLGQWWVLGPSGTKLKKPSAFHPC